MLQVKYSYVVFGRMLVCTREETELIIILKDSMNEVLIIHKEYWKDTQKK